MKMGLVAAVLMGLLSLGATVVRADDVDFAGLMPGQVVPEEELARYFGGAVVNFDVNNGSVATNSGAIDTSQLNSLGQGTFSGGINTIHQFQGDNNTVNVTIDLTVNLNTVTVTNSGGAAVSVNQSLDFGGGVVGGYVH
jgi:hypothetical protein